jgi:hypothetical protein
LWNALFLTSTTSNSATSESQTSDRDDSPERIGPPPPEDINRLVARQTSLLLGAGNMQTEIGARYSRTELPKLALLSNGSLVLERVRSRALLVPFAFRYGLRDDREIYAAVPFGVSFFERDNPTAETTEQTGVLGDIVAGMLYDLPTEDHGLPNSTVGLNVTFPTASDGGIALNGDQASLGTGVWRAGAALNMVESLDPLVFFGGVGYEYLYAEQVAGLEIRRGGVIDYYCGLGWAVSDDVSLSAQLSGGYQYRTSVNGRSIPNSDIEPASVRLGYMRRLTKTSRLQPFVDVGLTRDAADMAAGLRWIHDE